MQEFIELIVQPVYHIKLFYYIWPKTQTQTLDARRKEDDTNQPSNVSIDEVVQNGVKSDPGQLHVEHLTKEQNATSDNHTSAVSETKPDETGKQISVSYKQKENTVDAIQPKLSASFRKYCPSPQVKFNKRVSSKETRLKNSNSNYIGSLSSVFPFSPCFILLELWSKVSGNQNVKTYKQKEKTVGAIQPKLSSSFRKYCPSPQVKFDKRVSSKETSPCFILLELWSKVSGNQNVKTYTKNEKTVDAIQPKLSSNFCKYWSSPQVKFDKRVSSKEIRLKNSNSNFIGSWSSIIPLRPCFILLVLCCNVSGNQNVKMSLSVHHTQAIYDEPFTLLCHITNATKCTHLAFVQGKFVNNDLLWRVLARGDKPYIQQFVPSLYHSKNGITYNLTLLQLQPVDVGAWFRCECDEHNSVSKRLIQIDDRLTVNPGKVISTFRILNMMINFTTDIWNVYPEPENCTLTILSDNHSQVVSYNQTYCTTTTVPDLLNASYSGFSNTPFKLCNPKVTVMCHFGNRFISKHYTPAVCDDLGKKSEEMTSWNIIYIAITLCAVFLFAFSIVAATCVKRIWTKRRKHIQDITDVTVTFLGNSEYHDINIHP
ncbi:unnamed protein product [Mytilus coruscus]|uniref:Uncharacterized protein n=1 Tax=Mytilus coruscus TaxID=42192 RepID=A0A6J8BX90_MYTCO|nr:unnamed protein product [Mytilus coruscus]